MAALWAFTRDGNAQFLALLALCLVPVAIIRRRLDVGIVATALLLLAAASQVQAAAGERWLFSYYNVLTDRILPQPDRLAWFAARGMPVSNALLAEAGKWGSGDDWALYRGPALADFRAWTRAAGLRTYACYLLDHPGNAILEPLRAASALAGDPTSGGFYRPPGTVELPGPRLLYAAQGWALALLALVSVTVAVWALLRRGVDRRWVLPLMLAGTALPLFVPLYLADAMEVERHALGLDIQLRLGLWLLLLVGLDTLRGKAKAPR